MTQQQNSRTSTNSPTREMELVALYGLTNTPLMDLEDNTVGIILADARECLKALLPSGLIIPIVVYRSGNYLNFFNHKLQLCGGVEARNDFLLYGNNPCSNFYNSKFFPLSFGKSQANQLEEEVKKKFGAKVYFYNAIDKAS